MRAARKSKLSEIIWLPKGPARIRVSLSPALALSHPNREATERMPGRPSGGRIPPYFKGGRALSRDRWGAVVPTAP